MLILVRWQKSMCLAAKGRLQGWAAKLLLLWVGFFLIVFFQIYNHVTAVSFLACVQRYAYAQWLIAGESTVKPWKSLSGRKALQSAVNQPLGICDVSNCFCFIQIFLR